MCAWQGHVGWDMWGEGGPGRHSSCPTPQSSPSKAHGARAQVSEAQLDTTCRRRLPSAGAKDSS